MFHFQAAYVCQSLERLSQCGEIRRDGSGDDMRHTEMRAARTDADITQGHPTNTASTRCDQELEEAMTTQSRLAPAPVLPHVEVVTRGEEFEWRIARRAMSDRDCELAAACESADVGQ
jgi:hypothetical protein